ncbi:MAG TPA: penicillin-binding protein 1A, partial [Nevskiaceae bacterium]|nr:penicillin-binding protein 1A [Nevskiaceae bacterium]
ELQLEVPMRVYTRDGKLIGEFGAERRAPLRYDDIPKRVIDAFLAAEDDRFFEHPGVDWQGLVRAGVKLAVTGEKTQGGSTITMQLARNVFLSPERSYTRKIREILLAMRIEREMTKQEILETYLNKIFLGQRAYGVGAASQVYFGRDPKDLTWAQASLLAGLPKAPSRDNPVTSPQRAQERRDYVLRRLRELGKISDLEYEAGLAETVVAKLAPAQVETDARYVAEMVRAEMIEKYGDAAYRNGFHVTTTVDSTRQDLANRALRTSLLAYDERHGYRGPEARLPPELISESTERREAVGAILDSRPVASGLYPAAVVSFTPAKLTVLLQGSRLAELAAEDFRWAALTPRSALKPGDIVRVRPVGDRWRLTQLPEVQGAFVALDPRNGAIQAVVGGYDFLQAKYNRVTQARRQAGSGFKPFLYAAAFESGYTPASVFLDAPVVFADASLEGEWRPENYDGDFKGPMRLREALVHSRNLVSIRVLQAVGINFARDYITRFGFPKDRIPRDLSMSLGSGSYTPLEMARGYAVLANGGYKVTPYVIDLVQDGSGKEIFRANPPVACDTCTTDMIAAAEGETAVATDSPPAEKLSPRVIDPRVAWMVDDVLREVTIRGTAAQARALGRTDIAGKTGTTNDETDAWFNGFTPELVAVAWVGFDQPTPLGRGEVGGKAALPMWMDFVGAALKDHPDAPRQRPEGMVTVRIDRSTGYLASGGDPGAINEFVPEDRVPKTEGDGGQAPTGVEDIF